MSKYKKIENKKPEQFKRLTGVKKETFELMVKLFKRFRREKKEDIRSSPKINLCRSDFNDA